MEPPSLLQEQSLIPTDGPLSAQNVVKRRHIDALWMAALHRLIQLLRITDQHHGFRRLRHRQYIGERHLRSFIHEQYVDALESIRPRPQPRSAATDRRS